ncbi:MAG: NAD(P)H-dependent glycerol-3-phosphate dehydrogenase [Gemmatimonadales bacterium]
MSRVAVIGAGSWGTTLADLLARKGHRVTLWAYEAEVVTSINERHENTLFLPGCSLAPSLAATGDLATAVAGVDAVVIGSPSHATRRVLGQLAPALGPNPLIVSATKGIDPETLDLMSDVAAQVLPLHRFVALSGPSFAIEVFQGQPTAVVAASADPAAARTVQELFAAPYFRVYTNGDVIGTQLAGSLKNVIAIAAGILEGLGLGHNPRAALITRGLAEMTRLGVAMGADPRTFAGLAGLGDLILTTGGSLSRNRTLGVALAHGETLDSYRRAHRTVAEGANTVLAAVQLGARHGVELPIATEVAEVLFRGKPARQAIGELIERDLKAEH